MQETQNPELRARNPSFIAPCLAGLLIRLVAYAVCAQVLATLPENRWEASVDVEVYMTHVRAVVDGVMPYGGQFRGDPPTYCEYPPGYFLAVLPPYLIAAPFGSGHDARSGWQHAYPWAFAVWMACWEALLTWLVGRCTWEATRDAEKARLAAWVYALSFACAGFATTRYDAVPAAFLMAALLAAMQGKGRGAAGLSAAGALVKWIPGALIAPLVIECRGKWKESLARVAVWLGVLVAGTVPLLAATPKGFLDTYRYHFRRVPNSETTHKLLHELGKRTGLWHLDPGAFTLPLIVCVVLCWLGVAWWLWRRPRPWAALTHPAAAVAILVPFLLGNKVFSPQFLLWVAAPFCVLARGRLDRVLYFALQAALVIEFPLLYCYFRHPTWLGVVMGLRCLLFLALAVRAMRGLSE